IQPFFIDCYNDCTRFRKSIPRIVGATEELPTKLQTPPTPGYATKRTAFYAAVAVLTFVIIFGCIVWAQLKSKKN
ncbi:hypothetical protein scyTo_0023365, partial [Scyliorhinus torazame]|nr:hypothetical protein [Scyliorhinus torazame]